MISERMPNIQLRIRLLLCFALGRAVLIHLLAGWWHLYQAHAKLAGTASCQHAPIYHAGMPAEMETVSSALGMAHCNSVRDACRQGCQAPVAPLIGVGAGELNVCAGRRGGAVCGD